MNEPTQKPQRRLTSLELSAPARGALRRLKNRHGMSFTHAIQRGLSLLEATFTTPPPWVANTVNTGLPEPLTPAERTSRKKGGAL